MSLTTTENKVQYSGNGSTTVFAFPYRFIEDTHIIVTLTNLTTGADTLQIKGINYAIVGAGSNTGGTITFYEAPSTNFRVTIERQVPVTQEVDYQPDDDFPAEVHEGALDKLTMIDQQLSNKLGRTLNAPATDIITLNPLPTATARANRTLVFDASGQPTASDDQYVNNATQAAASAAASAASAVQSQGYANQAAQTIANFSSKYLGGFATDPTQSAPGVPLVAGAIYFNTAVNEIRIYNGTNWFPAITPTSNLSARRYTYNVTSTAQTTYNGVDANGSTLTYDAPHIDVFINGTKINPALFTATTGNSIVFGSEVKPGVGDFIEIIAYTVNAIVEVQNGTITQTKLAGSAVGTNQLQDNSVTSAKLAASGVSAGTYALPNITVNTKGQITSISSTALSTTTVDKFDSIYEKGELGYHRLENNSMFLDSSGYIRWAGDGNYWNKGSGVAANSSNAGAGFAATTVRFVNPSERIVKFWNPQRETFILTDLGRLYTAGFNYSGRSGVNNAATNYIFTNIPTFTPDDPVVDFSAGTGTAYQGHCGAVTQSGKLYMWGANGNYQLGTGTTAQQNAPVLINTGAIAGKIIKKVFCGGGDNSGFTFVTDEEDNVYSCGYNGYGQCGIGSIGGVVTTFTLIQGTSIAKADNIYTFGGDNTYATGAAFLLRSGILYSTGYNAGYSLGLLDANNRGNFVPVTGLTGKTVVSVAIGGAYANAGASVYALCSDGTIVNWGRDDQGQLGRGGTTAVRTPGAPLTATDGNTTYTKIMASGGTQNSGTQSVAALGANGKLYVCGYGGYYNHGQGTNNNNTSQFIPINFNQETILDFTYVGGNGNYAMLAKGSSGRLFVWGYDISYRLGVPYNGNGNIANPTIAKISL